MPLELVDDPLERDIRKGPVVAQVLHVPVSLLVELVEEAIRFAVEFQGPDAELLQRLMLKVGVTLNQWPSRNSSA